MKCLVILCLSTEIYSFKGLGLTKAPEGKRLLFKKLFRTNLDPTKAVACLHKHCWCYPEDCTNVILGAITKQYEQNSVKGFSIIMQAL